MKEAKQKSICHYSLSSKSSDNVAVQAISRKDFCQSTIHMNDWLKKVNPKDGHYIAGFTDGEGSFNVSLKKRHDYAHAWKITASFNISQKDRVILAWIKSILRCGTLRERKDGVVYYEVTNVTSLKQNIIPFFNRFGFISANKKRNFSIFSRIVTLLVEGEHLNPEGLQKVLELREILNEGRGRKRKYVLQDVIMAEESSETTRKISL